MRLLYITAISLMISSLGMGQIVWESNLNDWSDMNTADDWGGTKTNMLPDSIVQSSNGPTFGSYLAELTNEGGPHRRFTSQGVALTEGQPYQVEVWVKGEANVRVGLYDNDQDGFDFGYSYEAYVPVSSGDVFSFVQTIVPDTTFSACEIILSFTGGTIEVDRVEVRIGELQPATPKTVAEIQTAGGDGVSPEAGVYVETSGVVTAVAGNGYWIQDGTGPWSGLRVMDSDNTPSLGDVVVISGVVEEFFSETRLNDVDAYAVTGTMTVPTPYSFQTTFEANDEQFEGVLIQCEAVCTELPNNFDEWFINDASGPIMLSGFLYEFSPMLGSTYRVTGPLEYSYSNFKIVPRNANDVELILGLEDNNLIEVAVYPNPVADELMISRASTGTMTVTIYDSNAAKVSEMIMTNGLDRLDVSALATGAYTLVFDLDAKRTAKQIQIVR